MQRDARRATLWLLGVGSGLCLFTILAAGEISGRLNADGDSVFGGYAYASYALEASGRPLSVSVTSKDLDAYLILRSPEGKFLTNDDGGGDKNAKIAVQDPAEGTWTAFATSYAASTSGSFSIAVEGASSVAPTRPADLGKDLIEAAFLARGVTDPELERARKIQLLKDQLTLPSVRRQLTEDLRRAIASSDAGPRERYEKLESRERELEAALDEIGSLGKSRDFLRELLEKELSTTRSQLDRTSTALEESVMRREALTIVLGELEALDVSAVRLLELQERLQASDGEIHETRDEIERLKIVVDESVEGFAARLLDSSLVRVGERRGLPTSLGSLTHIEAMLKRFGNRPSRNPR